MNFNVVDVIDELEIVNCLNHQNEPEKNPQNGLTKRSGPIHFHGLERILFHYNTLEEHISIVEWKRMELERITQFYFYFCQGEKVKV